jgi:hypothetical protein
MITLASFIRDGRVIWKAFTAYGATEACKTQEEARLAGISLIREAQ